jgi:hypothetical protein
MHTQPTMTCDVCGYVRTVDKSPESTERWWKKYHNRICAGNPEYRAGFGPRGVVTGQQLTHKHPTK